MNMTLPMESRSNRPVHRWLPLCARTQKGLVAVFFVLLLVVGLAVVPDYGVPMDENVELLTLQYCHREYVRLFVGDDPGFESYFESLGLTEHSLQEYVDRDYGMAVFYPTLPFLWVGQVSTQMRVFLWHAYLFLLFMLGCWALYCIGRHLFGSRVLAATGVLFLYLSPRFFAEGHYNNNDTVMMALVLVMLWQGLRLMQSVSLKRILAFTFVSVLAANLRVIGLLFFGLISLFILIHHILQKTPWRRILAVGSLVLAGFVGLYYTLTPNAWGQPWMNLPDTLGSFSNFARWDSIILFEGQPYHPAQSPLPRHYIVSFMLLTTPLFLSLLMAVGQFFAGKTLFQELRQRALGKHTLFLLLCTIAWLAPLAYYAIRQPLAYNGWRHYQFVYGPLLILALYGVHALGKALKRPWARGLASGVLAVCLAVTAVGIVQNHPYQYSYFNPLAGNAPLLYDFDYWHLHPYSVLNRLLTSGERNEDIPLLLRFGYERNMDALPNAQKQEILYAPRGQEPNYLYFNQMFLLGTQGDLAYQARMIELEENYDELFQLESYGRELVTVYERREE